MCEQEQPLLIQDLLEQEKREQQQQQPPNNSMLLAGQQQQHHPHHTLLHDQQPVDPLLRAPVGGGVGGVGHPMRQYPATTPGGLQHMNPNAMMGVGGQRLAAPINPGWGPQPRHPQEVTLQQRSPHQMMAPHQVPILIAVIMKRNRKITILE